MNHSTLISEHDWGWPTVLDQEINKHGLLISLINSGEAWISICFFCWWFSINLQTQHKFRCVNLLIGVGERENQSYMVQQCQVWLTPWVRNKVHTPLISFDFQSDSGFWICLQPIGHWSGYKWRNEFEKILIYTCLVSELSLGEDNPMFYYMLGIT